MEEIREEKIGQIMSWLQATARGKLSRQTYRKLQTQKMALYCIQRTIRNFMIGKTWLWWQLWMKIKPTLRSAKFAEIKAGLESRTHEAEKKIDVEKQQRMKAEAVHQKLMTEKNELEEALSKGSSYMREMEGKVKKVENEKREIDRQVSHFLEGLSLKHCMYCVCPQVILLKPLLSTKSFAKTFLERMNELVMYV